MASINDPALQEISILLRAFEQVFRKLIRLLIGKISLRKVQELIQIIFVEESEAILKQQKPDQNVALADLALLADVDTRTIKKARSYIELSTPLHRDASFLGELIPEVCVLDFWESHSKYVNEETSKPKTLRIRGSDISFETLVNESTSTCGVSIETYLSRLTKSKSIRISDDGETVQLVKMQYMPNASSDQAASLKIGLAVVGNLLDTISHNLTAPAKGGGAFYQRGCWTTRLSKKDRLKLRNMTRRFLSKSDEKARDLIRPYEKEFTSNEHITAGISMFYFEEDKAA